MKHDKISEKAHVWTVTCGPDGRLRAELDEHLLATLDPMAHALVIAATRNEASPPDVS
jgi:hypothetical protein